MERGNAHRTVRDRLFEVIKKNSRRYDEFVSPYAMTQYGLAKELGISVGHVSAEIKKFEKEGRIDYRYAHVRDPSNGSTLRRCRVYIAVHPGERVDNETVRALSDHAFRTLGPRGCRELSILLAERANGGP